MRRKAEMMDPSGGLQNYSNNGKSRPSKALQDHRWQLPVQQPSQRLPLEQPFPPQQRLVPSQLCPPSEEQHHPKQPSLQQPFSSQQRPTQPQHPYLNSPQPMLPFGSHRPRSQVLHQLRGKQPELLHRGPPPQQRLPHELQQPPVRLQQPLQQQARGQQPRVSPRGLPLAQQHAEVRSEQPHPPQLPEKKLGLYLGGPPPPTVGHPQQPQQPHAGPQEPHPYQHQLQGQESRQFPRGIPPPPQRPAQKIPQPPPGPQQLLPLQQNPHQRPELQPGFHHRGPSLRPQHNDQRLPHPPPRPQQPQQPPLLQHPYALRGQQPRPSHEKPLPPQQQQAQQPQQPLAQSQHPPLIQQPYPHQWQQEHSLPFPRGPPPQQPQQPSVQLSSPQEVSQFPQDQQGNYVNNSGGCDCGDPSCNNNRYQSQEQTLEYGSNYGDTSTSYNDSISFQGSEGCGDPNCGGCSGFSHSFDAESHGDSYSDTYPVNNFQNSNTNPVDHSDNNNCTNPADHYQNNHHNKNNEYNLNTGFQHHHIHSTSRDDSNNNRKNRSDRNHDKRFNNNGHMKRNLNPNNATEFPSSRGTADAHTTTSGKASLQKKVVPQSSDGSNSNQNGRGHSCEPCKQDFASRHDLLQHQRNHRTCEEDGCNFTSSAKALQLHFVQNHQEGPFRIILDTPEDIEKWREERRRNWPTPANIEAKKRKLAQDREDGILVKTKEFVYRDRCAERDQRRGRGRGRGRGVGRGVVRKDTHWEKCRSNNFDSDREHRTEKHDEEKGEDSGSGEKQEEGQVRTSCSGVAQVESENSFPQLPVESSKENGEQDKKVPDSGVRTKLGHSKKDGELELNQDEQEEVEGEAEQKQEDDEGSVTVTAAATAREEEMDTISSSLPVFDKANELKSSVEHNCNEGIKGNVANSSSNICSDKEEGELESEEDEEAEENQLKNKEHEGQDCGERSNGNQSNGGKKGDIWNKEHGAVSEKAKAKQSCEKCQGSCNCRVYDESDNVKNRRTRRGGRGRKRITDIRTVSRTPRRRVSLLEMLLANEIRHERNVILQCIRYIVKNDYLQS